MKTVGIITTFRQPNFGSVLQAFALQYIIRKMGYDVIMIDYKYPNDYHWEAGLKWGIKNTSLRNRIVKFKQRICLLLRLKNPTKMELLNMFIKKEMKCSKIYDSRNSILKNPPIFDIYVSGSDQIWNPNTMFGDMSYMFDFTSEGAKKIAYSSSFSCDTIPLQYIDLYKKYLSRFSAIGVREKNGQKIITDLNIGLEAKLVLDPTLLLNSKQWHSLGNKSKKLQLPHKYILFYMLAYTYSPEEKMCELLNFVQQRYKLPIIALSKKPKDFQGEYIIIEENQSIGCYEFLQLFEKAEMVVTSSFHGTAYSLNFGKPLLALEDGKSRSDDRIYSLLNAMELTSQLIFTNTELTDSITPYYNVEKEQQRLEQLRSESLNFLQQSLNF